MNASPGTAATPLPGASPSAADRLDAVLRRASAWLSQAFERHRRRRHARAIFRALHELDDRTLRDLGFHRSEIWSVAAEATGAAEWTRVRKPLRPRAPA